MITDQVKQQCILESKNYLLVRSPDRVKQFGEVFTPTQLVLEILEQLPAEVWEEGKTYLDPTCGNGQFLAAVLIIKMSLGHARALATIYGVDFMEDNVNECRQRLIDIAGDTPQNWEIVRNNIRCENGLTYDYKFNDNDCEVKSQEIVKPNSRKIKHTVTDSPLFG